MKEKFPIRANNVVLEDIKTGFQLKGVLIRPAVESESSSKGKISRFVQGAYYVVSSEETRDLRRMDAIVHEDTFQQIVAGIEVKIKSHLTSRIDLKFEIDEPLNDVLSQVKSK